MIECLNIKDCLGIADIASDTDRLKMSLIFASIAMGKKCGNRLWAQSRGCDDDFNEMYKSYDKIIRYSSDFKGDHFEEITRIYSALYLQTDRRSYGAFMLYRASRPTVSIDYVRTNKDRYMYDIILDISRVGSDSHISNSCASIVRQCIEKGYSGAILENALSIEYYGSKYVKEFYKFKEISERYIKEMFV